MELDEEMGESASSPGQRRILYLQAIANDVCNRLLLGGKEEAVYHPSLVEDLASFFERLPFRYISDMKEKPGDIFLHKRILEEARDPDKRPALHCRFLQHILPEEGGITDLELMGIPPLRRGENREGGFFFEACSMLGDLHLDGTNGDNEEGRYATEHSCRRLDSAGVPVHQVIFSTVDKPKVLSQLSTLLSGIGLNIREAQVYSTADGYCLDVFLVDGWHEKETFGLEELLNRAISRSEVLAGSQSNQELLEKVLKFQQERNWEIKRTSLKIGEKISSGSHADLHHGLYLGLDVAVKLSKPDCLNEALKASFRKEVNIMMEVQHRNVVRFIGACTKPPHLCIVAEYLPRGSLFDFLHKEPNILDIHLLLKFAIDICKGMNHLHQHNIIHRDLKTSNLLLDAKNVVKVTDFGLARFQSKDGEMTGETGTYKWMAPEVMRHQPYDLKADIYSFGIVLWELATGKVPYENMTPIQAAMSVGKGKRPAPLPDAPLRFVDLMRRCWDEDPAKRPAFSEIILELQALS